MELINEKKMQENLYSAEINTPDVWEDHTRLRRGVNTRVYIFYGIYTDVLINEIRAMLSAMQEKSDEF